METNIANLAGTMKVSQSSSTRKLSSPRKKSALLMLQKARQKDNMGQESQGLERHVTELVDQREALDSMRAIMVLDPGRRTQEDKNELVQWFCSHVKLFELLSKQNLASLVDEMEYLEVPKGTLMCKQNSYGDEFFVVLSGGVSLARDGSPRRTGSIDAHHCRSGLPLCCFRVYAGARFLRRE